MIDWADLEFCGGPNGCEGRKYDESKKDCQDCLAEAGAGEEEYYA